MFHISTVALFDELIDPVLSTGVVGRAVTDGRVAVSHHSPREFTHDPHRSVDDRPYGGGPGMVMLYQPMRDAISAARRAAPEGVPVLVMSAQGRSFDQALAAELADGSGMVLVAGRYEGIDERLMADAGTCEISIGDFVMSGGEIAAAAIIDAVVRLLPDVLGHQDSSIEDSFVDGLLDCPHYTRPEEVDGFRVPGVLLSGDHAAIRRWRLKQALGRTWLRRPDLLQRRGLSTEEEALLAEFKVEQATETPTGDGK